ncbi:MAG: hypothetical protein WCQ67_01010 [Treponema sp.]
MDNDLKNIIDTKQGNSGFIKVTDNPVTSLSSEQKVVLNRKGNILFNNGDIEGARRIFITTGYSDGLTRVGGKYEEKNEDFKALKMYLLAHNKKKSDPIIEKIAGLISITMKGE